MNHRLILSALTFGITLVLSAQLLPPPRYSRQPVPFPLTIEQRNSLVKELFDASLEYEAKSQAWPFESPQQFRLQGIAEGYRLAALRLQEYDYPMQDESFSAAPAHSQSAKNSADATTR
jgi:hypothetical protein